jgi:starvation-inducible outer membrane lipoprotein
MRSARPSKLLLSLGLWAVLAGCGARIPPLLASQVAWDLSFPEVRRQPEAYVGRTVVFGGIVTQIDTADGGYRAVVMELPLDGSSRQRPAVGQPPRGLFIVLIPRQGLSPELRSGAEVTVVGEVLGKGKTSAAEGAEEVPLLEERYIHVWGASWWPRIHIGIWGGIPI